MGINNSEGSIQPDVKKGFLIFPSKEQYEEFTATEDFNKLLTWLVKIRVFTIHSIYTSTTTVTYENLAAEEVLPVALAAAKFGAKHYTMQQYLALVVFE